MSELLTIPQTAERLGLTVKAVEKRIERGTIQSLRNDGRRVVPLGEVARLKAIAEAARGPIEERFSPSGEAIPLSKDLSAFLERLETLAAENGRFRALQEVGESERERLEVELFKARAEVRQLEEQLAAQVVVATPPTPQKRSFFRRRA